MDHDKIDFIGIGAFRSGTTWLAECLRRHPEIMLPLRDSDKELDFHSLRKGKELDFFTTTFCHEVDDKPNSNYDKGLEWYFDRFPPAEPDKIRGEFSPQYLADPESSRLIHQTFPEIKLIVMLRNPVEMIDSLYWFRRYAAPKGLYLSLEEVLDKGYYLQSALHHENLKPYFDLFPREQTHVIIYDDVVSQPEEVLCRCYAFLGVRDEFLPACCRKRINETKIPRSETARKTTSSAISALGKSGFGGLADRMGSSPLLNRVYHKLILGKGSTPEMDPKTRERLEKYFAQDIVNLEVLLDRDLSAWKSR